MTFPGNIRKVWSAKQDCTGRRRQLLLHQRFQRSSWEARMTLPELPMNISNEKGSEVRGAVPATQVWTDYSRGGGQHGAWPLRQELIPSLPWLLARSSRKNHSSISRELTIFYNLPPILQTLLMLFHHQGKISNSSLYLKPSHLALPPPAFNKVPCLSPSHSFSLSTGHWELLLVTLTGHAPLGQQSSRLPQDKGVSQDVEVSVVKLGQSQTNRDGWSHAACLTPSYLYLRY